jgi:hypothetical protein
MKAEFKATYPEISPTVAVLLEDRLECVIIGGGIWD